MPTIPIKKSMGIEIILEVEGHQRVKLPAELLEELLQNNYYRIITSP